MHFNGIIDGGHKIKVITISYTKSIIKKNWKIYLCLFLDSKCFEMLWDVGMEQGKNWLQLCNFVMVGGGLGDLKLEF